MKTFEKKDGKYCVVDEKNNVITVGNYKDALMIRHSARIAAQLQATTERLQAVQGGKINFVGNKTKLVLLTAASALLALHSATREEAEKAEKHLRAAFLEVVDSDLRAAVKTCSPELLARCITAGGDLKPVALARALSESDKAAAALYEKKAAAKKAAAKEKAKAKKAAAKAE